MNSDNTCCGEEAMIPGLNVRLIGTTLYITYNGKTQQVPLNTLGGGGGTGEPPKTTEIEITSDNQTYFSNIIPIDDQLLYIYINGDVYFENKAYTVTDRNVTWTGEFNLEMTDTLILATWPL